jgi:hypothetical protein
MKLWQEGELSRILKRMSFVFTERNARSLVHDTWYAVNLVEMCNFLLQGIMEASQQLSTAAK